jgi:large subunit ribosomal protein L3
MAHQITKKHNPRRGSLQYYPIVRNSRAYVNPLNYANLNDKEIGGFAGYKVGMIHLGFIDENKNSPTFKSEVVTAATIIECPPLLVCGARFYGDSNSVGEVWGAGIHKNVLKKVKFKENNAKSEDLKKIAKDVRLIVSTQPWLIGLKHKPEIFELGIGGNLDSKAELTNQLLGKQVEINSVLRDGELIDVAAVTKGKGFAGSVKRYGVKVYPVHASKSRRKAGNLGAESMAKVQFTVPQHGGLGFNSRVEYNKFILKIVKDPAEINRGEGYKNYGKLKASSLVVRGSVPGSAGRLIIFRKALRPVRKAEPVKVNFIK